MDTVQNSPTTFRELREAKGYSQEKLAAKMDVWRSTIQGWDRGRRPSLGELRHLSRLFEIELDALTATVWKERPGPADHCPLCTALRCETVYPDNDEARHLYVRTRCVNPKCKKTSLTHRWKGERHFEMCRGCRWESWRSKPKPTFHHGLAKGVQRFLRAASPHWSPDGYRERFHTLTDIWPREKPPHKDELKIQTQDRLKDMIKACHALSGADRPEGAPAYYGVREMKKLRDNRWAKSESTQKPGSLTKHTIGGLVMAAELGATSNLRGECFFCGGLHWSKRQSISHRRCYRKFLGSNTRGRWKQRDKIPVDPVGPGRPPELAKHWTWFLLRVVRDQSPKKIAVNYDASEIAVKKGIAEIKNLWVKAMEVGWSDGHDLPKKLKPLAPLVEGYLHSHRN